MNREFKVDDEVTWTRKTGSRVITFTTMRGKIISTEDPRLGVVIVKYRNGQTVRVHTSRLRHADEQNELTDVVMSLADVIIEGLK